MSGLPELAVLLDDGTGTFPHDVTPYVRLDSGISVSRGRGDEFAEVQPSQMSLVLENTDGRFTLGDSTYGCAVNQGIRLSYQFPSPQTSNLLTANAASMESSVADWAFNTALGIYVAGAAIAQSATFAQAGSNSCRVTWTASGSGQWAGTVITGLIPGRTYTWSVYVRVPSGDPDPRAEVLFLGASARTSTKNAFTRLSVSFTAPADGVAHCGVQVASAAASDLCYIDAAMVNQGSSAATFTTTQSVTYHRFTGRVSSWPVGWPSGGDEYAVSAVSAVDRLPALSRRKLRSLIQTEILADDPMLYWPMGEPEGSTRALPLVDTSGDVRTLRRAGPANPPYVFGDEHGPATDDSTAVRWNGDDGQRLRSSSDVTLPTDFTLELVVTLSGTTGPNGAMVTTVYGGAPETFSILFAYQYLLARWFWAGGGLLSVGLVSSDSIWEADRPYHVAIRMSGGTASTFRDGVLLDSDTPTWTGGYGQRLDVGELLSGSGEYMALCHLAIYDEALSDSRIAAHAAAAVTGWPDDNSGERIERILGYAGVAPADLAIATGVQENVPAQDTTDRSPVELVTEVVNSEAGYLFVNGSGQIVLHDRHHRSIQQGATNATLDAVDLGPDTSIEADMQFVTNYAAYQAAGGGESVAYNQASIDAHEQYPDTGSLLVATDTEALAAAQWRVGNYAEPQPRFAGVVIDLMTQTSAKQEAVIGLELGDRFTAQNLPAQAIDGATSVDLVVEGCTETIGSNDWALSVNTSNFTPQAQAWILDDATYGVLDTTTRLHI